MGMFDDLIPQGSQGAFDDLVPAKRADPKIGQPEELTFAEKLVSGVKLPSWLEHMRGTAPARVIQGLADPAIGAMQMAANALPDSTGIPQAVNKRVADLGRDYKSERALAGSEGADDARFVGNVLSPVNALIARIPGAGPATTTMGRARGGGVSGFLGGLTAPVEDDTQPYWGQKGAQLGLGTATGMVLGPVLGKVADVAVRKLGLGATPNVRASTHDLAVEDAITGALKDVGQRADDLSPDQMNALRVQVSGALQKGHALDAAAALRKADFDVAEHGERPDVGPAHTRPVAMGARDEPSRYRRRRRRAAG
jgi:hypothetical protein